MYYKFTITHYKTEWKLWVLHEKVPIELIITTWEIL